MISETMPLGIVLERREIDNRWEPYEWSLVAVVPGGPPTEKWRVIAEDDGWTRYHAGTLELELFRRETEGYRYNLANHPPGVYVVLRYDDEAEHEIAPFLATVCPFEAQAYLDGDEDLVEVVPMPEVVAAWVARFVEEHHVDEPHYKRKRKRHDAEGTGFGRGRLPS